MKAECSYKTTVRELGAKEIYRFLSWRNAKLESIKPKDKAQEDHEAQGRETTWLYSHNWITVSRHFILQMCFWMSVMCQALCQKLGHRVKNQNQSLIFLKFPNFGGRNLYVAPTSRAMVNRRQVKGQGHFTREPLWSEGSSFVNKQTEVTWLPRIEHNGLGMG